MSKAMLENAIDCTQNPKLKVYSEIYLCELRTKDLFEIGLEMMKEQFQGGSVPHINVVSWAWEQLTNSAISKGYSIFD